MANGKYEFTGETMQWKGRTLRHIRALNDIHCHDVRAGYVGGWIEGEGNLSTYGNAWVCDDAKVFGDAQVCGDARVYGNATVCDNAMVCGNASVCGNVMVCDNAWVSGNAWVSNNATVGGAAMVYGRAWVYDNATVCGDARVDGAARVCGDAKVGGAARVCGDAEVGGNAEVMQSGDYIVVKNCWSSMRWFTYTRSNRKWSVGGFYGTGEELIEKAYADSETSGRCYEAIVRAVESIENATAGKGDAK